MLWECVCGRRNRVILLVLLVEDNLIWLSAKMVKMQDWIIGEQYSITGSTDQQRRVTEYLTMEYQLRSIWLWSINCGVSNYGVSVAEYLTMEYQLRSIRLWSIKRKVSDCGVSAAKYLTVGYHLQSIWLWSISCEVSDHGVSTMEFLTMEY